MKRTIYLITILIVALSVWSCGKNGTKQELRTIIEEVDSECPISLGSAGNFSRISYVESQNTVKLIFSVNEDILDLDALRSNENLLRQNLKLAFSKENMRELVKKISDADATLKVVYNGLKNPNDKCEMTLTAQDVKEIANAPISEEEHDAIMLENNLAITRSDCPMQVDELTTLTNLYDDGNNIVYEYDLDEEAIDMDILRNIKAELKNNITENFDDPAIQSMLELTSKLNKGLIYRYHIEGSTEGMDIRFTPSEIKSYCHSDD